MPWRPALLLTLLLTLSSNACDQPDAEESVAQPLTSQVSRTVSMHGDVRLTGLPERADLLPGETVRFQASMGSADDEGYEPRERIDRNTRFHWTLEPPSLGRIEAAKGQPRNVTLNVAAVAPMQGRLSVRMVRGGEVEVRDCVITVSPLNPLVKLSRLGPSVLGQPKLCVDAGGRLHAIEAIRRAGLQGLGYVWQTEDGWAERFDDIEYWMSVAAFTVDSAGDPHALIRGKKLEYWVLKGEGWRSEATGPQYVRDFAIDARGVPHIVCGDGRSNDLKLEYATLAGNEWVVEQIDAVRPGQDPQEAGVKCADLALNSRGEPVIAYGFYLATRIDHGDGSATLTMTPRVRYAQRTGKRWRTEELPDVEIFGWYGIHLALDRGDHPHLVFESDHLHNQFTYASKTGKEWQVEQIGVPLRLDHGDYDSHARLLLDAQEQPAIVFVEPGPDESPVTQQLRLARRQGGTWQTVTLCDGGRIHCFAGALIDGRPTVVFFRSAAPGEHSVWRAELTE